MDVTTLRSKSDSALGKELEEVQIRLKELRFKLSSNQQKNVREIRELRLTIARINTILMQRAQEQSKE